MPRRRSDADRAFDDFSEFLAGLPAWAGPVAAVGVYLLVHFVVAGILKGVGGQSGKLLAEVVQNASWVAPIVVLAAWGVGLVQRSRKRRIFDRQTGLESIRQLSWKEFEVLISEAFRRQGYAVVETGGGGADGGIDLILSKNGEETLVQCKRWKEWRVGVEKVRELYGIMASRGSVGGILVTSGKFTKPAQQFAEGKSLRLIDGPTLGKMIAGIQAKDLPRTGTQVSVQKVIVCPTCGSAMVLRTAKKGPNPGSQFWGCTKYPSCRGTLPIQSAV